ncbi:MAG TPA: NrfD/PsrC family molybdoenzyme membrane anchor subunit [Casimicrobiaceae bacterium]|jgi:Ni/Fe-hydrogenase subunit HybB-like protein|nr:NrfD/PsrC family molybdoenzyme membrane anchor subunit [Casimicrobiaceae bacterium]
MAPEAALAGDAPGPRYSGAVITDRIAGIVLARPTHWGFLAGLGVSAAFTVLFLVAVGYLFAVGVGIWGIDQPVAWAFAITNFVWWVGIGHAGTFISAFLLLLRQHWRTSINRFAEAMTIFAVAMAGLMPILHLGRPWFFYWLAPYPDVMNVWPQWRSPLVWDIFAIGTYIIVSIVFWYMGLLPDLATLRDRARTRGKQIAYGVFALGWRGEARHWHRYETAYLLLAGLATPLVISVHSVVSLDFSFGLVPGWHSTIFPPYFVAGALYSGFAMALVLAVPLRAAFGLRDFITERHLAKMGTLMLVTGLLVAYSYGVEVFSAYFGGDAHEIAIMEDRYTGAYAPVAWAVILCNVVIPQALWLGWVRRSALALFALGLVVLVGMWLERFLIIVQSLAHDFLPSSWHLFVPTFWDLATLAGSIGAFALMFLLFLRFLPAISMAELRKEAHHEPMHQ